MLISLVFIVIALVVAMLLLFSSNPVGWKLDSYSAFKGSMKRIGVQMGESLARSTRKFGSFLTNAFRHPYKFFKGPDTVKTRNVAAKANTKAARRYVYYV